MGGGREGEMLGNWVTFLAILPRTPQNGGPGAEIHKPPPARRGAGGVWGAGTPSISWMFCFSVIWVFVWLVWGEDRQDRRKDGYNIQNNDYHKKYNFD